MRNLTILGLSLFLGISVPQYFDNTLATSGTGPVSSNAGWVRFFILILPHHLEFMANF
jgi:hypothetical protein